MLSKLRSYSVGSLVWLGLPGNCRFRGLWHLSRGYLSLPTRAFAVQITVTKF